MNFHSPYQVMLQGIIGKTYNKVDVEIIIDKINVILDVLIYARSTERKTLARKKLREMERNRDFVIRQLNQQMLEEAQDGYK